jgi:hypothetical protein
MSASSGTDSATAFNAMADKVWENLPREPPVGTHRSVLMLTDGLTQEAVSSDYDAESRRLNLCILQLTNSIQSGPDAANEAQMLKNLKGAANIHIVQFDLCTGVNQFPMKVSNLLITALGLDLTGKTGVYSSFDHSALLFCH